MSTEVIHIYADGACRGNPGTGGWGVLMQCGSTEVELCGGERDTTNNRMELTAVIRALESFDSSISAVVFTDSQYVQKGISEWIHGWKRNGWKTATKQPVKNSELWVTLDALSAKHTITWKWIKGHAGHAGNERADKLAGRGIDELK